MKKQLSAFCMGLLFALGLGISQMTNPQKILHFLEIFGNWDPSLLVVFVAAVATYYVFYHWILNQDFIAAFQAHLAPKEIIEPRVVIGAVIFGFGWGMSGLCPGPAITGLGSGKNLFFVFTPAMLFGMFVVKRFVK